MQITEIEKILKALANKRRLQILKLLDKNKEMIVSEIAEKIDLSFRSTSRHLRLLYTNGVLVSRRESNEVYYSLHPSCLKIVRFVLKLY